MASKLLGLRISRRSARRPIRLDRAEFRQRKRSIEAIGDDGDD
jgi:hypothetical protein